ncbi:anti-sigma factor family protein [[Actinomadura] parvosata]|uniref:anti-sigma factor family protein n=1 Tax=[Actinomadura] parvosata TaxID=1955412 RepID=UPI00406CDF56
MEEGSLGCTDVLALATDYLDEALPPARHRTVGEHLDACRDCSAWLAQLLATIAALGCLRDGIITRPVLTALRESFSRRKDQAAGTCPNTLGKGGAGGGESRGGGADESPRG